MKMSFLNKIRLGGVQMVKKKKQKNKGADKENRAFTQASEGNPKLEGPNRPST